MTDYDGSCGSVSKPIVPLVNIKIAGIRIWQRKGPNTWGKTINDDFKGPGPLMKEPQDVFSRFFWLMIVSSNFLAAT